MKEMQVCELDRELTAAWMELANIKREMAELNARFSNKP